MEDRRVLIKLGGGLITFKDELCKVRTEILNACAEQIAAMVELGWKPIIVHGAGGFGHLRAKEFSLNIGRDDSIMGQDEAVEMVRAEMLELNSYVCRALIENGLKVSSHPPHTWSRGTGKSFNGTLERFDTQGMVIPVTHGDVNDCEEPQSFGILSGDHLMQRLSSIEGVSIAIFAMYGVDGIMTHPPGSDEENTLIEEIDSDISFSPSHDARIDVTGGISLKVSCARSMAAEGIDVWLVNGEYPQRMVEVLVQGETIGTNVVG